MRASRRTTVTASGIAVLGLAGCTTGGTDASSGPAATGPSVSGSVTTATAPDPDRVALDRATQITTTLLAELAAAPTGGRGALDPDGRFTAMHTEHLAVLARIQGASGPATPEPGAPLTPGVRAFRRHEVAAQRELAHLAAEAASGSLARLLASMSAGIAAHLSARSAPR